MSILVLGIGNTLMSDDGVGVHVVRSLAERFRFSPAVALLHVGTCGADCLPFLHPNAKVLVVDAVDAGHAPGTILRLDKDSLPAVGTGTCSHHLGILEMLAIAEISGTAPSELVVWGIQPAYVGPGMELSPVIATQLDQLTDTILCQLSHWGEHVLSN